MRFFISVLVVSFVAAMAREAPADQTCMSGSDCLTVTSSGVSFGTAIDAVSTGADSTGLSANGTNTGVYGTGASYGIFGSSTYNYGVYAQSSNGVGLYASTGGSSGIAGEFSALGGGTAVIATVDSGEGGAFTSSSGTALQAVSNTSTGFYARSNASGQWSGYFQGVLGVSDGLQVGSKCVAGTCSSDARLKKNVEPIKGALETVAALRPVTFEWIDVAPQRPSGVHAGFIAQEVVKVKPEWVSTDAQGFLQVDRDELPMLLVGAVRELKAQNDELRAEVHALKLVSSRSAGAGLCVGLTLLGAAVVSTRRKKI